MRSDTEVEFLSAVLQPLSAVPGHENVGGLRRHLFLSSQLTETSPAHIAVHEFTEEMVPGTAGVFRYTEVHAHRCWEIDLLIPLSHDFLFQIETDGHVQYLTEKLTISIPPFVKHRMEVVRGRGMLVCIVGEPSYGDSLVRGGTSEP